MSHGRSSYDLIKERCDKLKIDTSHFKTSHTSVSKISLDDIKRMKEENQSWYSKSHQNINKSIFEIKKIMEGEE